MAIMQLRIGSFSSPVWIMDVKDWSIFRVSTGSPCSRPSEEKPVPKSSSATRTPAFRSAVSCWITWQSSSKKTLSVTSTTSCRGSTPVFRATASSSSAKSPCCSCTPETLTARARAGSSASQGSSSVQPFSSTSVPISTIRPLRSAAGMNCAGGTMPPSRSQRASASTFTTTPLRVETMGW